MAAPAYDRLIREIYLAGRKGPLKVVVGAGTFPPFLEAGDVAVLDREPLAAVPGALLGLRQADGDVPEAVRVAAGADPFHQIRLILGVDERAELLLEPEALPEVGLVHDLIYPRIRQGSRGIGRRGRRRVAEGVGAHPCAAELELERRN